MVGCRGSRFALISELILSHQPRASRESLRSTTMNDQYWISDNGGNRGPYTLGQLRSMWQSGSITVDTLYWKQGFDEWFPLSTIIDVLENSAATTPLQLPPSKPSPQRPLRPTRLLLLSGAAILLLLIAGLALYQEHLSDRYDALVESLDSIAPSPPQPIPSSTLAPTSAVVVPSHPPTPKTYEQRDNVELGSCSYMVLATTWRDRIENSYPVSEPPIDGYLFVELRVFNDSKQPLAIPPFILVDGSGARYETSPLSYRAPSAFGHFDRLNPSGYKQGFAIFQVPPFRSYQLVLSAERDSRQIAYVKLQPQVSR